MHNNFLIGIPTFNEEASILNVITQIKLFISKSNLEDCKFDVVFYDDGSTDNTVKFIQENSDFKVIVGKTNKGLGHAMKSLFQYARENDVDGLIKLDGDGQMNPQEILLFVKKFKDNLSDVLYGNRFFANSDYKMPITRKIGSRFFKLLFSLIGLKVKDPTNGFIFVSKKYLSDFYIFGNFNAAQQILLDSKIRKLKFEQIDINLQTRNAGDSFIGIRYPIYVITSMIGLLLYRKYSTYLMIPGLFLLIIGISLFAYNIFIWFTGTATTILSDPVLVVFLIIGFFMFITGLLIQLIKKDD